MKTIINVFSIFILLTITLYSQNISGRFSSSIYTFERYDEVNVSNNYVNTFQMLYLNINKSNFSLRSYFNLENNLSKNITEDPRLRFYNLYLEARNIFNLVTIKLGRQPLFNSVAGGIFDGINVALKKDSYKLTAYYGGNVPAYQKLKLTDQWSDDYLLGGKFTTTALTNFQISLSYINKNFKTQDYWASRLDADLNPITVLIRNSSNQYKFASAEVNYSLKDIFSAETRFDYDLNFEKASKFELNCNYEQIKNLNLNLYYNYREPRIRYNSIFSVFDYGNTQEIEFGGDYILNKNLTLTGRYGYVKYKDDNSQRITIGMSTNYGSVNYRKTLGYAGELDAFSIYSAHSFLEGVLTPSVGISYTNYKLSENSETNSLASVLAGFNVRPFKFLSFDLQGQYMNNKIYKNDYRFFFKVNYWFYTNL